MSILTTSDIIVGSISLLIFVLFAKKTFKDIEKETKNDLE